MDFSNRFLAVMVVLTMGLSLYSTVTMLRMMAPTQPQPATGRATSDQANVTLSVTASVSIILTTNTIDFGTGYVNTTKTEFCDTNASLTAGPSYVDTGGNDCWTDNTKSPGPLVMENDGNINASVNVTGPANLSFFSGYGGSYPVGILYRVRENDTSTACAGTSQSAFTEFGGQSKLVCADFQYPTGSDHLAIDVQVYIPSNLPPGIYQNSTIIFTAIQA